MVAGGSSLASRGWLAQARAATLRLAAWLFVPDRRRAPRGLGFGGSVMAGHALRAAACGRRRGAFGGPLILIAGRGMRRFTRPMDDLIAAAGRIEQGDYSARIREYGPRELRSVARAFNSMSARLQSSDEGRRSFLADVAHELRTPLAVIRAEAEAIADGVHPADTEHLGTIVDATQSLDVLVEDLRALALTDTGSLVLNREAVETSALIDDSIALFDASGKAANVRITGDVQDGMPVLDVDPVRMRAALGNVIGNAIAHTPPGGSVRVDARLDGNHVEI